MEKDDAISKTFIVFLANALLYELIIITTLIVLLMRNIPNADYDEFTETILTLCGITLVLLLFFAYMGFRFFKKEQKEEVIFTGASAGSALLRLIVYLIFIPAKLIAHQMVKKATSDSVEPLETIDFQMDP